MKWSFEEGLILALIIGLVAICGFATFRGHEYHSEIMKCLETHTMQECKQ